MHVPGDSHPWREGSLDPSMMMPESPPAVCASWCSCAVPCLKVRKRPLLFFGPATYRTTMYANVMENSYIKSKS